MHTHTQIHWQWDTRALNDKQAQKTEWHARARTRTHTNAHERTRTHTHTRILRTALMHQTANTQGHTPYTWAHTYTTRCIMGIRHRPIQWNFITAVITGNSCWIIHGQQEMFFCLGPQWGALGEQTLERAEEDVWVRCSNKKMTHFCQPLCWSAAHLNHSCCWSFAEVS